MSRNDRKHLDDDAKKTVALDPGGNTTNPDKSVDFANEIQEIEELVSAMAAARPELDTGVSVEYMALIDELLSVRAAYEDHFDELEAKANAATVGDAFASQMNMHRGIRCPALVEDLITGGCRRGRPLKRPKSNSSYYLRYSLDDQGRLLKVETFLNGNLTHAEYLIRVGRKVYGIERQINMPDNQTSSLSLEEYDEADRLIRYATVLPDRFSGKGRHHIDHSEKIRYGDDGRISSVLIARGIPILKCLQVDEFQVISNDDGQITGFERDGRHWDALKRYPKGKRKPRQPADLVKRFNQLLDRHSFPQTLDLGDAIDAFEEVALVPIDTESDDLLFEAGHYEFTGEKLFWLSLTRQFDTPDPDNSEYLQLHLKILFKPEDVPMSYSITEWSNGDQAAFFNMVRHSELIEYIHKNSLKPVRYDVNLSET